MNEWIVIYGSIAMAVIGFFWRRVIIIKQKTEILTGGPERKIPSAPGFIFSLGVYLLITQVIPLLFGKKERHEIAFSIWAERRTLFGFSVSNSAIYTWVIIVVATAAALFVRYVTLKNLRDFEDLPSGAQNAVEAVIEVVSNFTHKNARGSDDSLASYIFTVGVFLAGCACVEMFGFRTPASDVTVTLALGIMTFILINAYGIKAKGVIGHIKAMSGSNPAVFVLKFITELSIPVSLGCRLFGNMLAGFVIMDLLYIALGAYAVGISSVVGLYFSVAHPLLQMYIFVTLTLTFINEAIE